MSDPCFFQSRTNTLLVLQVAAGDLQNKQKRFYGAQPPGPQSEDWPSSALLLFCEHNKIQNNWG